MTEDKALAWNDLESWSFKTHFNIRFVKKNCINSIFQLETQLLKKAKVKHLRDI